MNGTSAIDPTLGNIVSVLGNLGFFPLYIKADLEDPRDPLYTCMAELDSSTGCRIRFGITPARDNVKVCFTDGALWPVTLTEAGDPSPWFSASVACISDGYWAYQEEFQCEDFATYIEALRTIDWASAHATFDRHVDLDLRSGTLRPEDVEDRRHTNYFFNEAYSQPLSPRCHPFSEETLTPPTWLTGGAS